VKLWVDDARQAPEGWERARDLRQAQAYLSAYPVDEVSLDHDLGDPRRRAGTGLDLVRWMIDRKVVPETVTIHSWNPAGARAMQAELSAAGFSCELAPFSTEGPRVDVLSHLDAEVDQPDGDDNAD